jgi:hypothetical protein
MIYREVELNDATTADDLRQIALKFMYFNAGNPGVGNIVTEFWHEAKKQACQGKFFYSQEYEELTDSEIGEIKNHLEGWGFRFESEVVFKDEKITTHLLSIMW